MSASDARRTLRGRNVSRAPLLVHAYTAASYVSDIRRAVLAEYPQDELPFRLYIRYYDVPPRTCACVTAFQSEYLHTHIHTYTHTHMVTLSAACCAAEEGGDVEEADTGLELYLAPDCGPQTDAYYAYNEVRWRCHRSQVSPEVCTVQAGECADWQLRLVAPQHGGERAPDVCLLLRLQPLQAVGPGWCRAEPAPQRVRVRQAERGGCLRVSCRELRVRLCALGLPYGDVLRCASHSPTLATDRSRGVLRVRKRFTVSNAGSGVLELGAETAAPWTVLQEGGAGARGRGGAGARGAGRGAGAGRAARAAAARCAPPRASTPCRCDSSPTLLWRVCNMCVEVSVSAAQAWPAPTAAGAGPCEPPVYPPRTLTTTPLHIFDDDNVLKTVQLVLELEFPILRVQPAVIDFGIVADGDTRKMFFSVSHTSATVTLDIATQWIGGSEFKIWPPFLRIAPGCSANVYLQYAAIWRAAPSEGCAHLFVCSRAEMDLRVCEAQPAPGPEPARASWCRAAVAVRAAPAREHTFHEPQHDHTDDAHLLPPRYKLCPAAAAHLQ
ncbi:hypothetical protein HF086_002204 [Spodoptera exigua]|uniref:Uncharacterized protein n=1 Tax=Spodoptera exigua TaxID=7107 RepID=A0A922SIW8_SPOEX|nr:hypothetical protein HF086_002204 [Spodoptera exigua]